MKLLIRRNQTVAILGVLVMLVALMGLPSPLKTFLLLVLGLGIAGYGFMTHRNLQSFFQTFHDTRAEELDANAQDSGVIGISRSPAYDQKSEDSRF